MTIKPTSIVCAAIRLPNGHIIAGVRHYDLIMNAQKAIADKYEEFNGCAPSKLCQIKQGFLDNRGQFHDRFSALKIAKQAGQVLKKTPPEDRLFSEDLY